MPFAINLGVRIHYEVEGEGPPLVLQHGFGGSLENCRDYGYVEALKKDCQLILIDARGCGASDKPHNSEAYDLKLMIGDVVAVLNDLGIVKNHYFGYSMGGRIGFRIPIYAPERFHSLILGGATYPLHGDEDAKDEILIAVQQGLAKGLERGAEKAMEAYAVTMEERYGHPMPPAQRARTLANDPQALMAAIQAHRGGTSPKADEVLPHVALPCLVIVGEADPRYSSAKECANLMPNATFVSLPGLDHGQGFQRSDLALPHVKKFLAAVNQGMFAER